MKDLFWKYFTETGSIELYLQYKKRCVEHEREKEREAEHGGGNNTNKGFDSADGEQRRQRPYSHGCFTR